MKLDKRELRELIIEFLGEDVRPYDHNQITDAVKESVINNICLSIKNQVIEALNDLVKSGTIEKDRDNSERGRPYIYTYKPLTRRKL